MMTKNMKRLMLGMGNTQLREYIHVCCGLRDTALWEGCLFATSVLNGRRKHTHKQMLACIADGGISLDDADIAEFQAAWDACFVEPFDIDEQPAYVVVERMMDKGWTFTQEGWVSTPF